MNNNNNDDMTTMNVMIKIEHNIANVHNLGITMMMMMARATIGMLNIARIEFWIQISNFETNNSNDNNISRHLVDIKNDLSYIKDLILESPKQSNEDVPPDAMVRMMELAIQNPEQFEKIIELQNKSFDN